MVAVSPVPRLTDIIEAVELICSEMRIGHIGGQ
jgi:hypothetical protein